MKPRRGCGTRRCRQRSRLQMRHGNNSARTLRCVAAVHGSAFASQPCLEEIYPSVDLSVEQINLLFFSIQVRFPHF